MDIRQMTIQDVEAVRPQVMEVVRAAFRSYGFWELVARRLRDGSRPAHAHYDQYPVDPG